jgi:hypothetical protein
LVFGFGFFFGSGVGFCCGFEFFYYYFLKRESTPLALLVSLFVAALLLIPKRLRIG